MRLSALAALLALAACTTVVIKQRASQDLGCPAESIQLVAGAAGATTATGCGRSIEYACSQSHDGLVCNEQHRSGPTAPAAKEQGAEGGSCFGNDTCLDALLCIQHLCVKRHAEGQIAGACIEGKCDPGLVCVQSHCEPAPPPAAVGTKGGACYPNNTCYSGLRCDAGLCVASP